MFDKNCDQYWAESEYLSFDGILEYWCGNNSTCKEAKKFAIIAACERGQIKFTRSDGKNFGDPVQELMGRDILLIHRNSFETWAKNIDARNKPNLPLDIRSETTYLHIIGAMLETFVHKRYGELQFTSEAQLIEFLRTKFDGYRGLSSRTLADKFAAAKRALAETPV